MSANKVKDIENVPKIQLTENQMKVIKDKYLKDSPTVESWLMNVAGNIALSEILYLDGIDQKELFKGINATIEEKETLPGKKTRSILLHQGLASYNDWDKNFKGFVTNLSEIAANNKAAGEAVRKAKAKFYRLMSNFEFLPNSPTLMNAGRALQQLSGCYVLPVGDSIEEIYEAVKNMALVHKSGGGTGFSFSRLRPSNDEVKSTKGISSGPVSFMGVFDKSTNVVKQGGTRRGANMGILRYDHPDIKNFIHCKDKQGEFENFNISVSVDKKFMDAVKENREIDLINPKDGSVKGRLNAKDLFEEMIESAWKSGDPGIIFIDRINETESNPTPGLGMIESTNPCGEQPLLPYESCNLGSINLVKFVDEEEREMDYKKLKECVWDAVHFLDNVVDVNNYPLPKIEKMTKQGRRIGLGVMGWAESLVKLSIPYNSDRAYAKAEEVMKFVNDEALKASEELAKTRGLFPSWKGSIFDKESQYFNGKESYPRNSARTTLAPTGTIGITAGLQGAGIEPFFAIAYVRYNAAGIDALKKGETPLEKDTFFEVNPLFKEIAEKRDFFGLGENELYKKIDNNHKSIIGLKDIPEKVQKLFPTSHDISPLDHVKMQVAFQRHTNNAVSKTVNLRNEATIDDVKNSYWKAYELGAKGITIYRDGSKQFQILNITDTKKEEMKKKERIPTMSSYYQIQTGQGQLHIHINYDEEGPLQLFANITPTGTEISGMTTALGILISKYLEQGGNASRLIKHLNSIKGDKPFGFGPKRVDSIPHGISKALKEHLVATGKFDGVNGQTVLGAKQEKLSPKSEKHDKKDGETMFCPQCFSTNVEMVSGCSEPTCFDCGYSKCS